MDDGPTYLARTDPHTDRRRRRVALIALLVALCVIAVGVAFADASYQRCKQPPSADGRTVSLTVPEGASGEDVVASLASQGLINCGGFIGDLLLRSSGMADAIRAGSYDIPVGTSFDEILTIVTAAPTEVPTLRLTVPEGLRITSTYPNERSISTVVEEQTGVKAADFSRLAESGKLVLPPYLPNGQGAEGFLFPDTYEFVKKGIDARTIAHKMLEEFDTQARDMDLVAGAKALGLTPYEVVIVASMIEREAQVDDERALIAGVIYNRLNTGQSLGIDATLLYNDPTPDGKLSSSDLASTSPYNTRLTVGLPPTPIASPGRPSLEAALHPETTDYLYYVLCPPDGKGVHRFAITYAEHLANVRECLGG
ncbi:MAG: endolytic transglycosylase MltG [Actinomycetota bacterium]|nr:endolytic transglycosylase MltG [Actinomycetota bacterium]